jgi:hypothetical protein
MHMQLCSLYHQDRTRVHLQFRPLKWDGGKVLSMGQDERREKEGSEASSGQSCPVSRHGWLRSTSDDQDDDALSLLSVLDHCYHVP